MFVKLLPVLFKWRRTGVREFVIALVKMISEKVLLSLT